MQLTTQQYGNIVESLRKTESGARINDKRRLSRIHVQALASVASLTGTSVDKRFACITKDLSMGGIGLMQSIRMEVGAMMLVELPVRPGHTLMLTSRVIYSTTLVTGIYVVGLEFVEEAGDDLRKQWEAAVEIGTEAQQKAKDEVPPAAPAK